MQSSAMEGPAFIILFLGGLFYISQAARPAFSVQVSDAFLLVGKSVKITQATTFTEAGPLKFKFKVPFNVTAYMRILNVRVKKLNESQIQFTGSKTPNYTSLSGNADVNDAVTFDFGQVTPVGTVKITITFLVQLLNHPKLTNGEDLWVNLGAQFTNGSIWANQQAIKCFKNIDSMTVLKASSKVVETDDVLIGGSTVNIRLYLIHDPLKTTAPANSVNITILHPRYLVYKSMISGSGSTTVEVAGQSSTARLIAVKGNFNFEHKVDLTFTFHIDPSKTRPKGQINEAFVAFTVGYSFSSPSSEHPRRGNMKRAPRNKIQFYNKDDSCDTALGMVSGSITNNMIRVSSHGNGEAANNGRLNAAKAWTPSSVLKGNKNQFVEVNLQGIKEIHRIELKGNGKGKTGQYVRTFRIFYSLDCAVWKIYRTKDNKEFLKGNTGPDKLSVVALVPPIKAKCIRINPKSSHKGIAMRFELYGCASPMSPPAINLNSRTLLAETTSGYIYACNMPMIRKGAQSCCYFSKDSGATWIPVDGNIVNINFVNPTTKFIYGMGLSNTYYKCRSEPQSKCNLIPKAEYTQAKSVGGVQQAKAISPITTTDDSNSALPVNDDIFTFANSKKVGGSAAGVYYFDSSWKQQLSWDSLGD